MCHRFGAVWVVQLWHNIRELSMLNTTKRVSENKGLMSGFWRKNYPPACDESDHLVRRKSLFGEGGDV
jgi:hypothetical protein